MDNKNDLVLMRKVRINELDKDVRISDDIQFKTNFSESIDIFPAPYTFITGENSGEPLQQFYIGIEEVHLAFDEDKELITKPETFVITVDKSSKYPILNDLTKIHSGHDKLHSIIDKSIIFSGICIPNLIKPESIRKSINYQGNSFLIKNKNITFTKVDINPTNQFDFKSLRLNCLKLNPSTLNLEKFPYKIKHFSCLLLICNKTYIRNNTRDY